MKILKSILLAIALCLGLYSVNAQVVPVTSNGNSYVPNTLQQVTYLPVGSFQVTKAFAIDQIASVMLDTYSISRVGKRSPGPQVRIQIPLGSAPSKIGDMIKAQLLSIEVARPESDTVGYYVSLENKEGYQLFWGDAWFRPILVNGNWEAPENALNPKFRITSNLRFKELDGVEAIQVHLRNDEGNVSDSYYLELNGRGFLPVYFSGMKGELYAISRLNDGTEIRKAYSLNSLSVLTEVPSSKIDHHVNSSFENVNDFFAVNEARPMFTIRNAAESYMLNRISYTQRTDVVLQVPAIFVDGIAVSAGKCKIVFARAGTNKWSSVWVSEGDPIMIPFEPGEYWIYPQVEVWGASPENPETYKPYNNGGGGKG